MAWSFDPFGIGGKDGGSTFFRTMTERGIPPDGPEGPRF
jgi:hypothetical protein